MENLNTVRKKNHWKIQRSEFSVCNDLSPPTHPTVLGVRPDVAKLVSAMTYVGKIVQNIPAVIKSFCKLGRKSYVSH